MTDSPSSISRSILVVDDEPLVRIFLADFFSEQGFTVFEADNGDHAIAILEANPTIQSVLTDVQMPGSMDGLRLAHFIRNRWPPTLLVIASGAVQPDPADLPANAMFVAKPFDPHYVLGEIDRMSGRA